MIPGQPAPLAPRTDSADAELDRAREYLRRKLAEGQFHPARRRALQQELQRLEALRDCPTCRCTFAPGAECEACGLGVAA